MMGKGINECKDIKDYLILCNVNNIDKLSDSQLIAWAKSGKMGLKTLFSIENVINGAFNEKPDYNKAISMLKQAILENKEFICAYILNESCEASTESDGDKFEYFKMFLRDRKG